MKSEETVTLHDNKLVRITCTRHGILVEELPRKPCKRQLRVFEIRTGYAVHVLRLDEFIPSNLWAHAQILASDTFDRIHERLVMAVSHASKNVQIRTGSLLPEYAVGFTVITEQNYTRVAPAGASEPVTVTGLDFEFDVSWKGFSVYSPSSDFQQVQPYYTGLGAASQTAARKFYALAKKNASAFSGMSYAQLGVWFDANKINIKHLYSSWS